MSPASSRRACLLIADDDDALRGLFARKLAGAGHEVWEAATGVQALELLSQHAFDVVISDIHMPGLDGLQLLRIVHERQPDVAVLLVTGAPELESAMEAVEYGAFEYLTKPLDIEKLEASVARAVERVRAASEQRRLAESVSHPPHASSRSYPDVDVGDVLDGKYRLVRVIGSGGMGTVYEAVRDDLVGMRLAVKVLHPWLVTREDILARFRLEAEVIATIDHPNIVRIIDFAAPLGGPAFIAMELLHGVTLTAAIQQSPAFSERRVAFIASQVLSALAATHALNVIHRDLKPDNVILVSVAGIPDVVKVLDFGIAKVLGPVDHKLTDTGVVIGTPAYIPPEHARGEPLGFRADIYAVGCLMYEALTGRPPFSAPNYNALLLAIQHKEPEPIARDDVSRELVAVVTRALSKDPADRFATAPDMNAALAPWLPPPVIESVPPSDLGFAPTVELARKL